MAHSIIDALRRVGRTLREFHEDEDGVQALEAVMITAIGAAFLLALWFFGGKIVSWAGKLIKKLLGAGDDIPAPTSLELQ